MGNYMKKQVILLFIMTLCFLLSGCNSDEKKENEMYVYYLNADGNALIQEVYPDMEVEQVLEKLKMHGVLNGTVKVEKYKLRSTNLELYFDTDYLVLSKSMEVLTRAAIVQTMTQLDDIDFVTFYVGQDELINANGEPVGLMKAEDFVQNTGSSIGSYQTTDLLLYFSDKDGLALKEKKISDVRYNVNTSMERLIVEQLMKGTTASGTQSTIPESTTLLGVSVKEEICYVNFDSKFVSESYDLNPEVAIYSIVNSLLANSSVTEVQILIDGESSVNYKNSVDLSRPLSWKEELIKE
jgi:germination protein M